MINIPATLAEDIPKLLHVFHTARHRALEHQLEEEITTEINCLSKYVLIFMSLGLSVKFCRQLVLIIFSFYPTNATLRDSFLQQMLTILSAEDINKDWATISPSTIGPHCIGKFYSNE